MKNVLCFVTGAAIGSLVTWKLIEKKYKDLADEEIASVVETFKEKKKRGRPKKEEKIVDEIEKVNDIVTEEEYSTDDEDYTVEVFGKEIIKPYIISPEQFREDPDYDYKTLIYYSNHILVDEDDEIIDYSEIDNMVGNDSLDHFGEYEPDSVYVRNDEEKTDYEILKSEKTFSEINRESVD